MLSNAKHGHYIQEEESWRRQRDKGNGGGRKGNPADIASPTEESSA